MPFYAGHMLLDSAVGHRTCRGSYFEILETSLDAYGIKVLSFRLKKARSKLRHVELVVATDVRHMPMRLGNVSLFVEILVLRSDVPHLLSVTLPETCVINLQKMY